MNHRTIKFKTITSHNISGLVGHHSSQAHRARIRKVALDCFPAASHEQKKQSTEISPNFYELPQSIQIFVKRQLLANQWN